MQQLYPFTPNDRIYIGQPVPWPINPVTGQPAELSDPPQSAPDAPPTVPDGKLARRLLDNSGWELVADTRGVWYDATGSQVRIDSLDVDVSALTREAPPDNTSMLVNGEWQPDPAKVAAAAKATADAAVTSGMAEAARQIAVLQDAVDLDIATAAEAAAHTAWRKYRVLLSRALSDPAYPDVTLPTQPENVVP